MPATQWQRSASSTDMPVPKACSALRSVGNPASYPLVKCADQAIQKKIGCAWRVRRRRCGRGGARHLQHAPAEGEAAGIVSRRQCLQVGRPGKLCVDRLEPAGGLQQQGRGLAAPIREERELSPNQIDTGLLKVAQRPSLRDREQVPSRVERAGPDFGRRCFQRPLGAARRGRASASWRARGMPLPQPCRHAPAPGPADRTNSAATSSSGPGAAFARCQARRSGSCRGSVTSASAACTFAAPAATPIRRPPSARGDDETAPECRTRPGPPRPRAPPPRRQSPASRQLATPAPDRRPARPRRSAADAGSGPGEPRPADGSSLRCRPTIAPRWEAQIRRPAPAESIPEAIPAMPAGCLESRRGSDRGPA